MLSFNEFKVQLNEETGAEQGARLLADMDSLYPKWTTTSTSGGDKDIYKKAILKYLTKECGASYKKDIQQVIDQVITKQTVIENGPKTGRRDANLKILRSLAQQKILLPPNS